MSIYCYQCVKIFMLLILCALSTGQTISISTTGNGDLQYLNDFGFDVTSRRSLVFDVKGCRDAILVLHETHAYHHNAIEIELGGEGNQWSTIRAKCQGCPQQVMNKGSELLCDAYKTFWLTWRNPLTVRVGTGREPSNNTFLVYQAEVTLNINYLYLTSESNKQGQWRIDIEKPPRFVTPPEREWTEVTLEEDVVVGSTVYNVSTENANDSLDVTGDPGQQHFTINNSELKLIKQLKFGERKYIEVVIRASNKWGSVNQSMIINIKDVPEAPLITLSRDLRVLEELPHGTLLPGLFTVIDDDAEEHLTFSLHGEDSQYFSINPVTGELRTDHRLDREHAGNEVLDKLNLLVQDSTGRESLKVLALSVVDVDEFPTTCEQDVFYVSDIEDGVVEISNPVLVFNCSDRDWGSDRTFRLVGNGSGQVFWLHRAGDVFQLSLVTKQFKFEEFRGSDDSVTLTVVDDSVHEVNTSYTTVAIIKIVRNKYLPKWVWPPVDLNASIPEVEVTENIPAHTVITTLNATGAVVYTIQRITTAAGKNAPSSLFNLHPNTGIITVTTTLDGDSDTGGSEYYDFHVVAEGARPRSTRVNATFRLVVRDVNDNRPRFTQSLFFVDVHCPTNESPVLARITARDPDSTSILKFAMSPSLQLKIEPRTGDLLWRDNPKKSGSALKGAGGSDSRRQQDYNWRADNLTQPPGLDGQGISRINEKWKLRLLSSIKIEHQLKPPYNLLKVVVSDSGTPEKADSTYVLVNFICSMYHSPGSAALKSNSVEQWLFKAISGILAILLLCVAAIYIFKRTTFGTTSEVTPQNTTPPSDDDENRVTLVQPFREMTPPEFDSSNQRTSAIQEELSILDLSGPVVPEKRCSESTLKT